MAIYRCPTCRGRLAIGEMRTREGSSPELEEGTLTCLACGRRYPIVKGIPRFVSADNYAASFGYQWTIFARTQVGGAQKQISQARFDATTRWPNHLEGQRILEAGCGAGRFSEIALETGAEVYSCDLSGAVEACQESVSSPHLRSRHHVFQADLYQLPLPHEMFDLVFCFGVLQHCPDVRQAYLSLIPFLRPGGELVVDCYQSQPVAHLFNLKYRLRPVFRGWPPDRLYAFCSKMVSMAYDVKWWLARYPMIGHWLARVVPIGPLNYEPAYRLSIADIKEIKTLSLFDGLSPTYDRPQRLSDFRRWTEEADLDLVELTTGYNGINVRARRRCAALLER